jgi:hypothetical protein
MLEESLFKTNYLGRDGFRWWVGQVSPNGEYTEEQSNGGGWGNRVKVRILGYHPYSQLELPNKDLPWAQCLLSTTAGSGAANKATSVKVAPGDTVFGFFLDGDNAQVPVIVGVFGRTTQVPSLDFENPFTPFTGKTSRITNDGSKVAASESNEQNATSQPSPVAVDKKTADKINKEINPDNDPRLKVNPSSNVIGQKVTVASTDKDSAVQKIKNETENFVSRITNITDGVQGAISGVNDAVDSVNDAVDGVKQNIFEEIDGITASIQGSATRMVQDMTTNLSNAMIPVMNGGLQKVYDITYATILAATGSTIAADKAGTIAQALFIGPVKKISDAIPCITNQVINGIGDTIKSVFQSVADNVTNFVSCIGDQVVGALMNHIIGGVVGFIEPLLGGVDKILNGFTPLNFLRSSADAILGLADKLGCEEIAPEFDLASNEWVIGKGSSDKVGVPVNEILETANAAQVIAENALTDIVGAVQDVAGAANSLGVFDFANPSVSTPGFGSALGKCYAGPPELGGCGGTKIKIFGGGVKGVGGVANAILQIAEGGRGVTGSVIGVDLVNGGGGYTFPPFVEIVDECNKGYGASARAIIDYDPDSDNYQKITDIYVVSEGVNYTPNIDTSEKDYINNIDDGAIIVDPGIGYNPIDDRVTDTNKNVYKIKTDINGRIIKLIKVGSIDNSGIDVGKGIIIPSVTDSVEYAIASNTGSGAILRPKLVERPDNPQGEVKQVIDCISNDDNLVGYVNGEPYYGPFHVHPSNGRKMVGSKHVSIAHQYIYNTKAESLIVSAPVSTTTQVTQVIQSSTTTETAAQTTTTTTTTPTTTTTSSGGSVSTPTPTPTPSPTPTPTPSPPPSSGGGYGGGY